MNKLLSFSSLLVVTLLLATSFGSCELQTLNENPVSEKDATLEDDCGLYYASWRGRNGSTVIYKIVEGVDPFTASLTEVVGPLDDLRFHISLDASGIMYLVDENTGDIYEWDFVDPAPGNLVVAGADWYPYGGEKQFTQNLVVEFSDQKHILIGELKNDTIYHIDLTTGSVTYGEMLHAIAADTDWDIEGADIAATTQLGKLFVFSKGEETVPGIKLYVIDLLEDPIEITAHPFEASVPNGVNGAAFYDKNLWLTANAEDSYLFQFDLATGELTEFTLVGDVTSLYYGDLGSCATMWPIPYGGVIPPDPVITDGCLEVNPGNAKQNTLFELWTEEGDPFIDGDDLNEDLADYDGEAIKVRVTPQKKVTIMVNDVEVELLTNTSYTFEGALVVNLYNDAPENNKGQATGQWVICISSEEEIVFTEDHHGNK